MYAYSYPRPAVTVDCVILRMIRNERNILLIKRDREPFKGCWALPGGFIEMNETLEESAARELQEETGLHGIGLHQSGAYGDPLRDPRGRTITIAYYGFDNSNQEPKAGDDANEVKWFLLSSLPPLAFDHLKIITETTNKLIK